jgi:integrase
MTIGDFLVIYERNHVSQVKTANEIAGTIRKYFGALLSTPLTSLTPLQIEEWFHGIGASSPSMANKCVSILRTMFEKARDWRLFRGENPVVTIKKYPGRSRTRFVQPEEMPRLMAVLQREPEQLQCDFLLCLLFGCRWTEAITVKWQEINFISGHWYKPHTKTDRAQTVPVPMALLKRLEALPRYNDYVFPFEGNRSHIAHKGHLSTSKIFYAWKRIRTAAGLPDVTVHDLRRTCASWLACHGANLAVIGNVLNHSGLAHTAVYAQHVAGDARARGKQCADAAARRQPSSEWDHSSADHGSQSARGVAEVKRSGRLGFSRKDKGPVPFGAGPFTSNSGLVALRVHGAGMGRLKVGRSASIAVSKVCLHHRAPQEQFLLGNSLVWAKEIKLRAELPTGELLAVMQLDSPVHPPTLNYSNAMDMFILF